MKFTYWKLRNKIFIITIVVLLVSSFIVYFTLYPSLYQYSMGETTVTIEYESDIVYATENIKIDEDYLLTHMYTDENRERVTYTLQLTEKDIETIFSNFVIRGYFLSFRKYTTFTTKYVTRKHIGYPGYSYFSVTYNGETKKVGGYNAIYIKSFNKFYNFLIEYIDDIKNK